jgi:hypothetical protein
MQQRSGRDWMAGLARAGIAALITWMITAIVVRLFWLDAADPPLEHFVGAGIALISATAGVFVFVKYVRSKP